MGLNELFTEFKMKLYDADTNILELLEDNPTYVFIGDAGTVITKDSLYYINQGVNASVWKGFIENKVVAFKIFFDECRTCSLPYGTYQRMKQLPLKNMVQATEIFRNVKKLDRDNFEFDAYLMPYVSSVEEQTLLDMPSSLLIHNIANLQADVELLANQYILMRDIKRENSIFHAEDSMLYLTDIDMFRVVDTLSKETILKHNYNMLLYLIKDHLRKNVRQIIPKNVYKQMELYAEIDRCFSTAKVLTCPPAQKVEKAFSCVETPKQYFLKR